jgi:DNA-binding response OmpR family regulator
MAAIPVSASTKVLVVDDNVDFAQWLAYALAMEGYDVEVALNGKDAVQLQRRFRAQVAIVDVCMPQMDGIEAMDAIRQEFPETRVVMMSGESRSDASPNLPRGRLIDAFVLLRKPFELGVLLEKLGLLTASPAPSS